MGFNSYKGGFRMGAGFTPSGSGYPLMQSCDIQVSEDGKRLDTLLAEMTGKPIVIETAEAMDTILATATKDSVGAVYKYTGNTTDTYTQGALYIIEEGAS